MHITCKPLPAVPFQRCLAFMWPPKTTSTGVDAIWLPNDRLSAHILLIIQTDFRPFLSHTQRIPHFTTARSSTEPRNTHSNCKQGRAFLFHGVGAYVWCLSVVKSQRQLLNVSQPENKCCPILSKYCSGQPFNFATRCGWKDFQLKRDDRAAIMTCGTWSGR